MLSAKQEAFAQNVIQGMNQADAYRAAYSAKNMSDKTIWEAASRLMADSKVSARVKELRDLVAAQSIMTAQERLEWLTALIKNENVMISDKLKASDQMNKMQGEYVQKVEANVNNEITINIELSDD